MKTLKSLDNSVIEVYQDTSRLVHNASSRNSRKINNFLLFSIRLANLLIEIETHAHNEQEITVAKSYHSVLKK